MFPRSVNFEQLCGSVPTSFHVSVYTDRVLVVISQTGSLGAVLMVRFVLTASVGAFSSRKPNSVSLTSNLQQHSLTIAAQTLGTALSAHSWAAERVLPLLHVPRDLLLSYTRLAAGLSRRNCFAYLQLLPTRLCCQAGTDLVSAGFLVLLW